LLAGEDRGLPVLADSACGFRIVVADAGHSVVVNPFRCAPSSRADSPALIASSTSQPARCAAAQEPPRTTPGYIDASPQSTCVRLIALVLDCTGANWVIA
jgi:hypothetical protein